MSAKASTAQLRLEVTIGADWGCEHTDEDGENYAAFVRTHLANAYRGVAVSVSYDARATLDKFDCSCCDLDTDEVRTELQDAWEAFCEDDWPARA